MLKKMQSYNPNCVQCSDSQNPYLKQYHLQLFKFNFFYEFILFTGMIHYDLDSKQVDGGILLDDLTH